MLFQLSTKTTLIFSVFERHAELTERERVHWDECVAVKLSRLEPTGLSYQGRHAGKVRVP